MTFESIFDWTEEDDPSEAITMKQTFSGSWGELRERIKNIQYCGGRNIFFYQIGG